MTMYVELDFETASDCDLKKAGAWVYAEHMSTEILCLAYTVEGEEPRVWTPPVPDAHLAALASNPDVIFVAHNAAFEQAIWRHHMVRDFGFPEIPVERWEDTMAAAAWKALPLALDQVSRAINLPVEKDKEGNKLTLSMSRPDKKTGMLPEKTPERLDRIAAYCAKDVEVEGAVRRRLGLLSEVPGQHERRIWIYDQKINQRGVRLDMEFVRAGQRVIDRASAPLREEFRELTGGINPGQVAKIVEWVKSHGVELDNLRKKTISGLMEDSDVDTDGGYQSQADDESGAHVRREQREILPGPVRRVLEIRQMLGSASIKKLAAMRACVGEDGRARGLLQYHAASTGRWGGRLLQPQNFPRGSGLDQDTAIAAIKTGDPAEVERALGVPAIEAVASSLRHALMADPGKVFLVGDYAGIEARIVLALAGQHDKAALMASGADVYLDMAEAIYGVPKGTFNKKDHVEQRQIGKNTVLGCGFGMGWRKFREMYCAKQSEEFARQVIDAYRKTWAPEVPRLWYALDDAAFEATTGKPTTTYGVEYRLENGWLTARLPSRWQKLWYYAPQLGRDERFNRDCWTYSTYKGGKLSRAKAYGGLLTENTVQGLARGILAAAIDRLERAEFPVVLSAHDETVCEVDEEKADLKRFEQLMAQPTLWSEELKIPIAVEAWSGNRYRK